MPKPTIELLPKTYNYTIGVNNADSKKIILKTTEINGNISNSK